MKEVLTEDMLQQKLDLEEPFSFDVCYTIADVFYLIEKGGWERLEVYESNGYQVDWWESFTKEDVQLDLSGCLWYGGLEGLFLKKE